MRDFHGEHIPKPKLDFSILSIGHSRPLDLEIGAGQGLHAIRYAQTHGDRDLLAVEKTHERFARLSRRLQAHSELTNLFAFQADAVALVRHFLPERSLSRVFLLYPNPYPKAKQANLRWHNRPFLGLLLSRMKPLAELTLATNLQWYADEAENRLTNSWGLELTLRHEVDSTQQPRTHFEKKYQERGEKCWNLVFRKSAPCLIQPGPVE